MAGLVIVQLSVPEERLGCAAWIQAQSPETTADALDLTEACFNALQREASHGEVASLEEEVMALRRRCSEQQQEAFDAAQQAVAEARAAWDSSHVQLQAEVAALRSGLIQAEIEADHATRQQVAAAREAWTSTYSAEQERLELETKTLQKKIHQVEAEAADSLSQRLAEVRSTMNAQHHSELQRLDDESASLRLRLQEQSDAVQEAAAPPRLLLPPLSSRSIWALLNVIIGCCCAEFESNNAMAGAEEAVVERGF